MCVCMRARECVRECGCVLVKRIKCFDFKRLLFAAELNHLPSQTIIIQEIGRGRRNGHHEAVWGCDTIYTDGPCARQRSHDVTAA